MITAKVGKNTINCYDGNLSKETLKTWASKNIILCPVCNKSYEYCHGLVKYPYFRHKDKKECESIYSEPETEEHIQGKIDLFNWIKSQDGVTDVELESWLPETHQRPDIKFTHHNETYVIEYQCTPISSEYIKRHELYEAAGIHDIWILGTEKYMTKIQSNWRIGKHKISQYCGIFYSVKDNEIIVLDTAFAKVLPYQYHCLEKNNYSVCYLSDFVFKQNYLTCVPKYKELCENDNELYEKYSTATYCYDDKESSAFEGIVVNKIVNCFCSIDYQAIVLNRYRSYYETSGHQFLFKFGRTYFIEINPDNISASQNYHEVYNLEFNSVNVSIDYLYEKFIQVINKCLEIEKAYRIKENIEKRKLKCEEEQYQKEQQEKTKKIYDNSLEPIQACVKEFNDIFKKYPIQLKDCSDYFQFKVSFNEGSAYFAKINIFMKHRRCQTWSDHIDITYSHMEYLENGIVYIKRCVLNKIDIMLRINSEEVYREYK